MHASLQGIAVAVLFALEATAYPAFLTNPPSGGGNARFLEMARSFETIKARQSGIPFGTPMSNLPPTLTPDPNDKLHQFQAPGPNDIRGPCPGMNTLANHGYIDRSGIVTFQQLIQGQKDLYNVDYDLGTLLATIAVALDGDIVSGKLSLGKEATAQTSALGAAGALLGKQPGLNGHNKFEGDSSLTRNDYYTSNGNNFEFNGTLYKHMQDYAKQYGNGNYDFNVMAAYRGARYNESRAENGNFYFGPKELLLFGAASFVYRAFSNGSDQFATEAVVSSFFGALPNASAPGGFSHVPERVPANWYRRSTPYGIFDIGPQIFKMYDAYPVEFGARFNGGSLYAFPGVYLTPPLNQDDLNAAQCALWQFILDDVPAAITGPIDLIGKVLDFVHDNVNPILGKNFGCPPITLQAGQGTNGTTSRMVRERNV